MRLGLAALLTLGAVFQTQAQPAAPDLGRGEASYMSRCEMCHALEGPGQGPDLHGVVGRKAGGAPDFNYSDAMAKSDLIWTAPQLDQFLIDPQKLVPGSPMQAQVPDAAERHDLIAYLASLKAK